MRRDAKFTAVLHATSKSLSADSKAYSLGQLSAEELIALQALRPERYPALLESAAASLEGGNHDVLMAFPGERLSCYADGTLELPQSLHTGQSFLAALDAWWLSAESLSADIGLPFHGGWFVYLSYELAGQIEHKLQPSIDRYLGDRKTLLAQAVRMPAAIVRRSASNEAWFVAEPGAEHHLAAVKADLQAARTVTLDVATDLISELHEEPANIFIGGVKAALEHIAAGDVYQVNLSRGWRAQLADGVTPQQLYQRLRKANPAPFAGLALLNDQHAVMSSSPERLIELRNGWVNTRPIAGTRPRANDPYADVALINELRAHPKERAEHIMLLDLERNDLGRLCIGGTVEVNEYMTIESYAHVHHIVSNVRGRVREDVTPGQAIAAVFPGGTITGCPKLRCMEIIAELECTPRGAYTGAIGYVNRDGSMDLNILIRTLELNGQELRFRAGAGIVADSIPERELEETRSKALGLIRAFN